MTIKNYIDPDKVKTSAVIGAGAVGASWSSLFLAKGINVIAYDPSPDGEKRAVEFIKNAWPALFELSIAKVEAPPLDKFKFVSTIKEAVLAADVIQENIPEKLALKHQILGEIDGFATPEKIIISSTGGIKPSELQIACKHPERFLVLHPFNPSHLIPLVEVIGGKDTAQAVIDWGVDFATFIGKKPIRLNSEATGHMTNRLQFALVREAVNCLLEGVASAQDIDDAVRYGLAPRWALMGSLLTLHLAGGPGGMKGILDHAGHAIEAWWTPTNFPTLTPEVKEKLVQISNEISNGHEPSDWESWRDINLVKVIKLQTSTNTTLPN
jgi:carnitine 3-dehydrogenase